MLFSELDMVNEFREEAQYASGEEVDDAQSEPSPERSLLKKNRVTAHLENIFKAQQRLEAVQTLSLSWLPAKQVIQGSVASIQVLLGLVALPSGLILRQREPLVGALLTYHGANLLVKGGLHTYFDRFFSASRTRVEKRQGSKKVKKGAAGVELLGQYSLRAVMDEIVKKTRERADDFREYRKAYRKMKESGVISPAAKKEAYENYLRGYIGYLDRLLEGQSEVIEGETAPKGLHALSKALKDYYQGLVMPNQEVGDVTGVGAATTVLLGSQAQIGHSLSTTETIITLATGVLAAAGDMIERTRMKSGIQSFIETIDREVEGLKDLRVEKALKLERIIARRLEREEQARRDTTSHAREDQSASQMPESVTIPQQTNSIAAFLDELHEEVGRIIHGVPEDMRTLFPISEEPVPLPIGSEPPERIERSITPPTFEEMERLHLRREVDRQIIIDIMEIAGRKLEISSKDVGWLDAGETVRNTVIEDPQQEMTDAALDEIVRYLNELDDRLTAHQSVRDFQHFHLAALIQLRTEIQGRLYVRERAKYRELILYSSASAFRCAILQRSHILIISTDHTEDISQEQLEDAIRQWMRKKSTREHDRDSLRRFLATCQETLDAIPPHMRGRDDKEKIVRRAGDVLDEFLPEVSMPDPEQVTAWKRRIDEIAALFNRVQATEGYDRKQRVPELLAGEDFVPSDVLREVTFAKGDLTDLKIKSVDTKAVIGSYVDREAWIVQDRAKIAELAAPLIGTPTPEEFQKFFISEVVRGEQTHLEEHIQLLRIPGPKGPIYFAYKGIQHIAAARVAGLPRIIARVYELRPRDLVGSKIVHTKYRDRYEDWLRLKEAGMIDGDFVTAYDLKDRFAWFRPEGSPREETLMPIEAKIRFQSVPWLVWFNLKPNYGMPLRSILEISRIYEKLYAVPKGSTETGPFDKLKRVDGSKLNPLTLTSDPHFHTFIISKGKRLA